MTAEEKRLSTTEFFETLNDDLSSLEQRLSQNCSAPQHPVLAIVAQPRAASTLLQQVLISRLSLGYVSNIAARFWLAPTVGFFLQKHLSRPNYVSHFQSEYGLTEGPEEPHEWGYFWQHWLSLTDDRHYCDDESRLPGLARTLGALESVCEAPLMLDNVYMMANLAILRRYVPNLFALHIRRSPFFVCNSILKARKKRYGSLDAFYGHRPGDIGRFLQISNPVEQVFAQVQMIQAEIDDLLRAWPKDHLLEIDYETLIAAPEMVVDTVVERLSFLGFVPERSEQLLPRFTSRNQEAEINSEWADALSALFQKSGQEGQ